MTLYLQCGRILGVTRDNRMVLCELPLGHSTGTPCAHFTLRPGRDYTSMSVIEFIEEQEKRSA